MPPVVIQPGLGDSLNRYLERLGRRGEEQRALQAQRDNLQARMDARRDENRTRMISQSIDNAAGLYTGEIIKDRASERRLGEAEDLQRLEGRPSRVQARSELGIPMMHNSKYDFLMEENRLDTLQANALARLRDHPQEYGPGQGSEVAKSMAELKELAAQLQRGDFDEHEEDFVNYTTQGIQELLNITPSGRKKPTHLDNVFVNDGSDPSNPLPKNWPMQLGKDGLLKPLDHPLLKILEKMVEQETYKQIPNPEFKKYQDMGEEDQLGQEEPDEFMDTGVEGAVAMIDMDLVSQLSAAMWGNARDEDVASTLLKGAPLEGKAPPSPQSPFEGELAGVAGKAKTEQAQALETIARGGAVPFGDVPRAVLDQLVQQGRELIWPDPVMHKGKRYHAQYVGKGKVELIEPEAPAQSAPPPTRERTTRTSGPGLVPPGVMKQ